MRRVVKDALRYAGIILAYCTVISLLGIGCPIRFLTGISCLGCGMTRACAALLQLDFAAAIQYHPLVFLLPVFALLFLFREKLGAYENWIWSVVFVLFLTVYLFRLYDEQNTVVEINWKDGLIYKIVQLLRKGGN